MRETREQVDDFFLNLLAVEVKKAEMKFILFSHFNNYIK